MSIIIGDIHGCLKTFEALLKQLPEDQIFLTGDMIDRGPNSKGVVQWVIDHKDICKTVVGNHEQMLLNLYKHVSYEYIQIWANNGGPKTMQSYFPRTRNNIFSKIHKIPEKHIEFYQSLPLYIDTGELIISHAGYSGHPTWEEVVKDPTYVDMTWYRGPVGKIKDRMQVFGHTPTEKVSINDYWICVDTGCFFKHFGGIYGRLSAIQYPSMKVFTQDNIDV